MKSWTKWKKRWKEKKKKVRKRLPGEISLIYPFTKLDHMSNLPLVTTSHVSILTHVRKQNKIEELREQIASNLDRLEETQGTAENNAETIESVKLQLNRNISKLNKDIQLKREELEKSQSVAEELLQENVSLRRQLSLSEEKFHAAEAARMRKWVVCFRDFGYVK